MWWKEDAQALGISAALQGLGSKPHLRVCGRITRCGLQLESSGSSVGFFILFRNQSPTYWRASGQAQHRSCFWFSVKFPKSVIFCGTIVCRCWSTLFYQVRSQCSCQSEHIRPFMLPPAEEIIGDSDFISQQDFGLMTTASLSREDEMKAANKATGVSLIPQRSCRLITLMQWLKQKEPWTKYWVNIMRIIFFKCSLSVNHNHSNYQK